MIIHDNIYDNVVSYRHVCWFVLWLQVATMTGFGPFCFVNQKSPRFFSTDMFVGLFCVCRWPP